MLLHRDELYRILIDGRQSCYVSKCQTYNPYEKSDIYDWHFEKAIDCYRFTDSYRGFNPYGGVEYIYLLNGSIPIWKCDYVGYVLSNCPVGAHEIYKFLKEARGCHLQECRSNLFSDFTYNKGLYCYMLKFEENSNGVLEKVDIYYDGLFVAQHIASGQLQK